MLKLYLKYKDSYFYLIISFFLLFYTVYRSEIFWDGEKRSYYYFYYIISFVAIFFSIISFFLSEIFKKYLIISLTSSIFTLYLFEGYLTIKEFKKNNNKTIKETLYKSDTGKDWDKRTKFQIYNELKILNNKIALSIPPGRNIKNSEFFPLSGISNTKTIHCNENGYYSIYFSDRYGFNNPDQEWDKKEVEYFLVGDSYTHGSCVNAPNDIASNLRKLSGKSVINLGYSGNGPLIQLATLREYLKSDVKKVLWIYYEGNDLYELNQELKNNLLRKYINNLYFSQNLLLNQNKIDAFLSSLLSKEIKSRINNSKFNFLSFLKLHNIRHKSSKNKKPASLTEFKKIISLAKEFTNKNNTQLYFVYLPSYSSFNLKKDNKNYKSIRNIINELNIPFIDIYKEILKNQKKPLKYFPFELEGHYNVEGYIEISNILYKKTNN